MYLAESYHRYNRNKVKLTFLCKSDVISGSILFICTINDTENKPCTSETKRIYHFEATKKLGGCFKSLSICVLPEKPHNYVFYKGVSFPF